MTSNQSQVFDVYLEELLKWNKKFNLTAITDPQEIKIKHFEDSLTILQAIKLTNQSVVDIGSGAGFPGIPLKIVCPEIKLTLIEATRKKVEFLKHVVSVLGLKNIEIIWGRAEELNKQAKYKEKFDVALARAVAKLDKLIGYCVPFLKPGGIFIAQKGPDIDEELKTAQKDLEKYGGSIKEVKNFRLSNKDQRKLIVIRKNR
ncbi:MAG: 16S rRNA (guanine(527)-N(7))-methyltransferase RsmG [Candidatus Saganbacteria bacterium]|nr:16S rRNA (guanine(527)-N(7))-methyltransferase RsmG [Candidatus Saganbacteria bacterium]